jgi:NAD(P)-dependent dehydrogenase (short-subunit alcohol dehydrogenase family)
VDLNLQGKRVLVTGGNSGLGAAMARAFAGEGARVAINYVSGAAEAERMAGALGAEALAVEADISDAAAVAAMFERLDAAWGGIDVLVNNAGIDGVRAPAWEIGLEDWTRVLSVNPIGAFQCAREALKRMVPQRAGVILNMSSVHEVIPWSGYSAYAASKAGLAALAKTLAQEAAPHNVRVLAIAPGAIKTPINRAVWDDPAGYADLVEKIPLGRIGTPEEIANMALVLASDVAGYVTGTSVFVDGGMTNYPAFAHGG